MLSITLCMDILVHEDVNIEVSIVLLPCHFLLKVDTKEVTTMALSAMENNLTICV